jgi:hypothetical protein
MTTTLTRSFTAETICELVQAAGFRAEILTGAAAAAGPVIRSASSGLAFEIRLLNPSQIEPKSFADLTFMAGLQLQGPLAPEIVNGWNASKRFSRLYIAQNHLVIAMDVVLPGGLPPDHLRAQIEIWDRLLQELLVWLRNAANQTVPKKIAPSGDAATAKAANGHAAVLPTDAPGAESLETAEAEGTAAARRP